MRRTTPALLLLAALAVAGCSGDEKPAASAAATPFVPTQKFRPQLTTRLDNYQAYRSHSLTLTVRQRRGEPVLERVSFAIPPGYQLRSAEPGARVGRIEARTVPPPGADGEPSTLSAALRFSKDGGGSDGCVEDPIATLEADEAPLDVYVEVVQVMRMVVCLPPPGELPGGAPIRTLTLHLDDLTSSAIGDVAWTAFFRPLVEGGDEAARRRSTAGRSVYVIPSVLELSPKLNGKALHAGDRVTFVGYLKEGGVVVGGPVTMWAGPDERRLRPVGRARTDTGGVFTYKLPLRSPGELVVQARWPKRDATKVYCEGGNQEAPAGCAAAITGLESRLVRLHVEP